MISRRTRLAAEVGGFVLEGHVPLESLERLLASGDPAITGLAVAAIDRLTGREDGERRRAALPGGRLRPLGRTRRARGFPGARLTVELNVTDPPASGWVHVRKAIV